MELIYIRDKYILISTKEQEGTIMTREDKAKVAIGITSDRLMDMLISKGRSLEYPGITNEEIATINEDIEVIKAELGDRLAGL